jgi:hypothetical protein
MKTLLARILCSAAHSMWQKDPTLGRYTPYTLQYELNLSFHYATELRNWFSWLDCDFDVAKMGGNRERPDIILHRRASHALNFLVIEIKREKFRKAVPVDLKQIRQRWFGYPLAYRFGAAVILEDDKPEFEVQILSRQDKDENPIILKHTNMGEPLVIPNADCAVVGNLEPYIMEADAAGNQAAVQALQQEMDTLVFRLYITPAKIDLVKGEDKT